MGVGPAATGLVDRLPICQNLTDWPRAAEMRVDEEEKAREVKAPRPSMKVSTGGGLGLVMSQIQIRFPLAAATNLPSGEKLEPTMKWLGL